MFARLNGGANLQFGTEITSVINKTIDLMIYPFAGALPLEQIVFGAFF